MRMSCEGPSAADVVNGFEEEQIANINYEFGEERRSRAIARAIVKARAAAPLRRTKDLADLVLRVFHGRKKTAGIRRHERSRRCASSSMTNLANRSGRFRRGKNFAAGRAARDRDVSQSRRPNR